MAGVAPAGGIPPLGVLIASSWLTTSAALCQRSAACFSRQRITNALSGAGTAGRCRVTGSGACVMWAARRAWGVGAVNGVRPASIS